MGEANQLATPISQTQNGPTFLHLQMHSRKIILNLTRALGEGAQQEMVLTIIRDLDIHPNSLITMRIGPQIDMLGPDTPKVSSPLTKITPNLSQSQTISSPTLITVLVCFNFLII
jgi:hypothetical protein